MKMEDLGRERENMLSEKIHYLGYQSATMSVPVQTELVHRTDTDKHTDPKRRYLPTSPHGVTTRKTNIDKHKHYLLMAAFQA
jgi:hypothetical protein